MDNYLCRFILIPLFSGWSSKCILKALAKIDILLHEWRLTSTKRAQFASMSGFYRISQSDAY